MMKKIFYKHGRRSILKERWQGRKDKKKAMKAI